MRIRPFGARASGGQRDRREPCIRSPPRSIGARCGGGGADGRGPDLQTLRSLTDRCARRRMRSTRARRARVGSGRWMCSILMGALRTAALVALHGRTGNLADSSEAWRAGPDAGITTVVLQSSQMVAQGMYCWDDFTVAARDVASGLRRALGGDHGDLDLVLGGFSQGGGVAARVALARDFPNVRGFVAVAPGLLRGGLSVDDIVRFVFPAPPPTPVSRMDRRGRGRRALPSGRRTPRLGDGPGGRAGRRHRQSPGRTRVPVAFRPESRLDVADAARSHIAAGPVGLPSSIAG